MRRRTHLDNAEQWLDVLRILTVVLASFFATLSLRVDFTAETFAATYSGYDSLYVALFAAMCIVFTATFFLAGTRARRYALPASALLALGALLGRYIHAEPHSLAGIFESPATIWRAVLFLAGRLLLYYGILSVVYDALLRHAANWSQPRAVAPGRLPFFVLWGYLFVCWLAYYLLHYPGLLSADSFSQVGQALGDIPLENAHPVAHTLLIGGFLRLGLLLGDINLGVAAYTVCQMLAMSAIFALGLDFLRTQGTPQRLWIPALLCWALYPIFPMQSMVLWKDILLAGSVVLLTIQIAMMVTSGPAYFKGRPGRAAAFLATAALMVLIKSNGILFFLITLPGLLIGLPGRRKVLALSGAAAVGLFLLVQQVLYPALGAAPGPVREVLSLPLQQLSRIMLLHEDEIDPFDVDTYYAFLPMEGGHEELAARYRWLHSDNIKDVFDPWVFEHGRGAFFDLWLRLCARYPADAFEQLLCSSLGYWYPEMRHWVYWNQSGDNPYGIIDGGASPALRRKLMDGGWELTRDVPVLGMLGSIGFAFVLLCLTALLVWMKRCRRFLLVFLPSFAVWLVALFSPVNAEFRYVFGMYASLPFLIPLALALPAREKPAKEPAKEAK